MYNNGFKRVSYGVQDNNPAVQRVINRVQPLENVQTATENARRTGFTSVNFDLIYGLPLQSIARIKQTIEEVIALLPDRIAFYSYAHVPWTSKAQRLFDEHDLPSAEEKLALYCKGRDMLLKNGYADIGFDHFALPHDELFKARENGTLHRNFMGYTTQNTSLLLGLGVSAISDAGIAFAQNEKTLHKYYDAVNGGRLPVKKGYVLNEENILFRKTIMEVSCKAHTRFATAQLALMEEFSFPVREELANDGLVIFNRKGFKLTTAGHYFIRNVCSAFDLHLQRNKATNSKQVFSKAI